MFGETTPFYVMIWNHAIETTIKNWLFGVPGGYLWDWRFSVKHSPTTSSKFAPESHDATFKTKTMGFPFLLGFLSFWVNWQFSRAIC